MSRILFVATLHHPQPLQRERAAAQERQMPPPLFPTSTGMFFWEKALRRRGYVLDIFYRNLPGYGSQKITTLKQQVYTQRITPQRILQAITHRLPYHLNPDLQKRNANLLAKVRQFQPDYLWLIGDNYVIHSSILAQIKAETRCKILYSSGTSPIVFAHSMEREAAPLYDLVLVNDYYHGIQWLELGAKDMLCLPIAAIDPGFHYPRDLSTQESERFSCDISFVGTLLPSNLYSERAAALEALRDFELGIWSVHDVPDSLRPFLRGSALGDKMLRVLSGAKVSLNVHGNFMRYGGNMRLFESAGAGAFQIVDNRPGVHAWFNEGEHLVVFYNLQDLREKVSFYLEHPKERQQIAGAAHHHVIENHTYEHRLDVLEAFIQEKQGENTAANSTG